MIFHPEEYKSALKYWKKRKFPFISDVQYKRILKKGADYVKFHKKHPLIHNLINILVLTIILGFDAWVLLRLGSFIQSTIWAGVLVGILHSYFLYSLVIFTAHEGAAHGLIIVGKNPVWRFFRVIANNLGRIALAEPDYYAKSHVKHHSYFTTPKDGEYLLFVFPKRLYRAFIPFASLFNIGGDFKAHSDIKYSPSRFLSLLIFLGYHLMFIHWMLASYSWVMIGIALILIAPQVAFWLDRLRQYTEHNVMPPNPRNGIRDFGYDFWAFLIGGGPWGQPCHLSHHLVPSLPWYNQLRLHRFIEKILTAPQRKVFFLRPFIGYPQLILKLIKITGQYQEPGK